MPVILFRRPADRVVPCRKRCPAEGMPETRNDLFNDHLWWRTRQLREFVFYQQKLAAWLE